MNANVWTDITDLLPKIDERSREGWTATLNELEDEHCWHASFCHKSAGPAVLNQVETRGNTVLHSCSPHRYRIHGRGATLRIAVNSALNQIEALTQPAQSDASNA